MWIIELLLGMALGGYVANKDFRNFVNCLVFRQKAKESRTSAKVKTQESPIKPAKVSEITSNGYILHVSEDDMNKWLTGNPALRKANEVTK